MAPLVMWVRFILMLVFLEEKRIATSSWCPSSIWWSQSTTTTEGKKERVVEIEKSTIHWTCFYSKKIVTIRLIHKGMSWPECSFRWTLATLERSVWKGGLVLVQVRILMPLNSSRTEMNVALTWVLLSTARWNGNWIFSDLRVVCACRQLSNSVLLAASPHCLRCGIGINVGWNPPYPSMAHW